MVEVMREIMRMIKSMDLEHFIGQMEENMWDAGNKENNMVEVNIIWLMDRKRQANGYRERE